MHSNVVHMTPSKLEKGTEARAGPFRQRSRSSLNKRSCFTRIACPKLDSWHLADCFGHFDESAVGQARLGVSASKIGGALGGYP